MTDKRMRLPTTAVPIPSLLAIVSKITFAFTLESREEEESIELWRQVIPIRM